MRSKYMFTKTDVKVRGGWDEYGVSLRSSGELLGYAHRTGETDWYVEVDGRRFHFQRRDDCATALEMVYVLKG